MVTTAAMHTDGESTVRMRWVGGCLLVDDPMPLELMGRLTRMFDKGAVLDPHLARMARAMNAMGMPVDTARLATALEPSMRERVARSHPDLPAGAREWLAVGQHGASSAWLFSLITSVHPGGPVRDGKPHPMDPYDLLRVVGMLRTVQGSDALPPAAASASPQWAALASSWTALTDSLAKETGGDGKRKGGAPQTYELMRRILDPLDRR